LKKVPFSHKEKKVPLALPSKNFKEKEKASVLCRCASSGRTVMFLEGGGGEGTFFRGRFPLGTKIRKKVSPAPLYKKL
jgi:hypothetical protein